MNLNIALKEWSIICDLLAEGQLALLLRKGGILEAGGPGAFEVEHPAFTLYPTWAHQKHEMIKPQWQDRIHIQPEPNEVPLNYAAQVAHVWQVDNREQFDKLDHLHCWSPPQIDMRFNYRPNNPLFLIAVRVNKLATPVIIPNRHEYGGCKSWVELLPQDTPDNTLDNTALPEEQLQDIITQVSDVLTP